MSEQNDLLTRVAAALADSDAFGCGCCAAYDYDAVSDADNPRAMVLAKDVMIALAARPAPVVSGPVPAFTEIEAIVSALGVTYTPQGVAIWLRSSNDALHGHRPIDLLAAGEFEPVARAVEALGDVQDITLGLTVADEGGAEA